MFQFTHPGRGATYGICQEVYNQLVSIHAPREGCDFFCGRKSPLPPKFQFTHPGRGATKMMCASEAISIVSIHAPREGCDNRTRVTEQWTRSFNSRTPGGVRLGLYIRLCSIRAFQFTHPGRGATVAAPVDGHGIIVSIHAPREGCDFLAMGTTYGAIRFNSRTPGGVRQCGAKLRIMGRINKRNLRLAVLL